jgi:hypothetical protein
LDEARGEGDPIISNFDRVPSMRIKPIVFQTIGDSQDLKYLVAEQSDRVITVKYRSRGSRGRQGEATQQR